MHTGTRFSFGIIRSMVLRTIGVFLIAGTLLCTPGVSLAADELVITPVIIDEKAKIRDILKETITVTNA
jgi:hypothetical protein